MPQVPGVPRNVTACVAPDDDFVKLTWKAPNTGGPAQSFEIKRQPPGVRINVGLVLQYKFNGLAEDTTYTFKVRSVNSAGRSAWVTVTATTPALARPGRPTLVCTPQAGKVSLQVTRGSVVFVRRWEIQRIAVDNPGAGWKNWRSFTADTPDPCDGSYIQNTPTAQVDLEACCKKFKYRARAGNKQGKSQWSTPVTVCQSTETAPATVLVADTCEHIYTNCAGACIGDDEPGTVFLCWTPAAGNLPCNVTNWNKWEVYRRRGTSGPFVKIVTLGGSTRQYRDAPLDLCKTYQHYVIGYIRSSCTSQSNTTSKQTKNDPVTDPCSDEPV